MHFSSTEQYVNANPNPPTLAHSRSHHLVSLSLAHSLQKIVASGLRKHTEATSYPLRSPGYQTIKNLKISDLEMNKILKRWISRGVDTYGYDTREAVCSWVVENIDDIMNIIPPTYPRTMIDGRNNNGGNGAASNFNVKKNGGGSGTKLSPQAIAVQAAGVLSILVVAIVAYFTYQFRDRRVFV